MRPAGVDGAHHGARVVGEADRAMQHAGQGHVIDIRLVAERELAALIARRRRAHPAAVVDARQRPAAPDAAASMIASMILTYPVHRHRLPASAEATSSLVGSGVLASSTSAFIRMPGEQKPHWDAPAATKQSAHICRPTAERPSAW